MARKGAKKSQVTTHKSKKPQLSQDVTKILEPTPIFKPNKAQSLGHATDIHQSSLLFSIPAEMRLRIYEMAFEDGYLFGIIKPRHWHKYGLVQHPLTLVCRQIRAESLPLYFNRFTLGISSDEQIKPSGRLFKAIGAANTSRLAIRITNPQIRPHSILLCSARRWMEKVRAQKGSGIDIRDIEWPAESGNSILLQSFCLKLLSKIEESGITLKWNVIVHPEPTKKSTSADPDDNSPSSLNLGSPSARTYTRNELLAFMSIE